MAHSHTPGPIGAAGFSLADGTAVIDSAGLVDGRDPSVDGTKLDGIEALADVTDATNVAAAGAGMIASRQEWAQQQRPARTALSIAAAHVAWNASTAAQHMGFTCNADTQFDNPTGTVEPDTVWMLAIVGDGSHEVTWGSYFDFGDGTAPDVSAMDAGKVCWVTMVAYDATHIHCWSGVNFVTA